MAGLTTHRVGFAGDPELPSNGRINLSGVDEDCTGLYVNIFLIFKDLLSHGASQQAVVDAHIAGLKQTLTHLPLLAGTAVNDDSGVQYFHVDRDSTFPYSVQDLQEDPDVPSFAEYEAAGFPQDRFDQSKLEPLLMFQCTDLKTLRHHVGSPAAFARLSFIKGGAILSLGMSHLIGDNGATDVWAKTWSRFSRASQGLAPLGPALELRYSRSWYKPKAQSDEAFAATQIAAHAFHVLKPDDRRNMWMVGQNAAGHLIRFSPEAIARLKAECKPDTGFVSTYDCITGVLVPAMIRCRLSDPRFSHVKEIRSFFPNNLRRKEPVIGNGYIGNSFAFHALGPLPLETAITPDAVKLIANRSRQAINEADLEYFYKTYDMKKTAMDRGLLTEVTCRINTDLDVLITSWASMDLDEYDWGFGPCVAGRTGPVSITGFAAVWPSTEADRKGKGVVVTIFLEKCHWDVLRKDEELFKNAEFVC